MSSDTYRTLADTICSRYPGTPVHCRSDRSVLCNSIPLERSATFFEYVVIDGKRYSASRTVGSNRSSLVHVIIPGTPQIHGYGEVLEIFQFNLVFSSSESQLWFAQVRWFKAWPGEREYIWDELCVSLTQPTLLFIY